MSDTPPMVCRVCKRALERHEVKGETSWHHHDQDILLGHAPVPVTPEEAGLVGRCDFCNTDNPGFILPARPFILGRDQLGRAQGFDENWSCCEACAKLIDQNNWSRLGRRREEVWKEQHGGLDMPEDKVLAYRHLWRALRKNISGSIRPMQ